MLTALVTTLAAFAAPELEEQGAEPGDDGGLALDELSIVDRARFGPIVGPSAIVNGTRSAPRSNLVALAGVDAGGSATVFCTGSVIQGNWVLTAAHCLTGASQVAASGLELNVIWGEDIVGDGYTYAIPWAGSFTYPGYTDAVFANDIGLIELVERVPPWVELTVLNDEPLDDTWIGTELTFVGYGITTDGGNDSGVLRETQIPIESFDEQYIMAFASGTNVCQGDSGGPSFRIVGDHYEQVGINAYVTPGCVGGSSGSTNIVEFLDFVLDHVPDALFEPAPQGPGNGGFGLGVADPLGGPFSPRLGSREGTGPGSGCSTTGHGGLGLVGLLAAALLVPRRRR